MRGLWVVAVLLSGCSLFDSLEDVTYQPGPSDAGDLGSAVDADLDQSVTDMAVDSQPDLVADTPADSLPDLVADMTADTGMTADIGDMSMACLSELPRTVLVSGRVCSTIPAKTEIASCDVIDQTGCRSGEYCDLLPISQTAFKTVCRDGLEATENTCEFVPHDNECFKRATVNDAPVRVGVCYPGSVCRGLKAADLSSPCARFCELTTAKGCNTAEHCVPIATQYSVFGVGRCATDPTDCP